MGKFGQLLCKDVSQISHHKEQHCRRCHGTSLPSQAAVCISVRWEQYAIFSFPWDSCSCSSCTVPFLTTDTEKVGNCIGSPCECASFPTRCMPQKTAHGICARRVRAGNADYFASHFLWLYTHFTVSGPWRVRGLCCWYGKAWSFSSVGRTSKMGRHLLFVAVMTGPQMWIAKIIWMLTSTSRVGKTMVR